MILNINKMSQPINYFIVSIYKVSFLFTHYSIYVQSQINLLIRKVYSLTPFPLLFIIRAVFQFVYKKQKKFSTFFGKDNGCHPNLLSNSHLKNIQSLKEKCNFISYPHLSCIA